MINLSGRSKKTARYKAMAEINMTPMVDVMMVLLIIFMVSAPLMSVGIPVDLPETNADPITDENEPLVISIRKDGAVFVQERQVSLSELVPFLKTITGQNPNPRIFVRGDKNLAYGQVVNVMGLVTSAGFTRVALIAQLPEE